MSGMTILISSFADFRKFFTFSRPNLKNLSSIQARAVSIRNVSLLLLANLTIISCKVRFSSSIFCTVLKSNYFSISILFTLGPTEEIGVERGSVSALSAGAYNTTWVLVNTVE
jgi:hypothetical protein